MKKLDIILKADSNALRERGLMFHDPLAINECAFFSFITAGKHHFWNKDVGLLHILVIKMQNIASLSR